MTYELLRVGEMGYRKIVTKPTRKSEMAKFIELIKRGTVRKDDTSEPVDGNGCKAYFNDPDASHDTAYNSADSKFKKYLID
jgi:hypothetical protein